MLCFSAICRVTSALSTSEGAVTMDHPIPLHDPAAAPNFGVTPIIASGFLRDPMEVFIEMKNIAFISAIHLSLQQ
jgi:hypothetical protein